MPIFCDGGCTICWYSVMVAVWYADILWRWLYNMPIFCDGGYMICRYSVTVAVWCSNILWRWLYDIPIFYDMLIFCDMPIFCDSGYMICDILWRWQYNIPIFCDSGSTICWYSVTVAAWYTDILWRWLHDMPIFCDGGFMISHDSGCIICIEAPLQYVVTITPICTAFMLWWHLYMICHRRG